MTAVNIALECLGIAVSLILLFSSLPNRGQKSGLSGVFIAMLTVNTLVLVCDAFTWVFENRPALTVLLYAVNFFVYSLGYVLTALFTRYLVRYIAQRTSISGALIQWIEVLCGIAVFLVALSLVNHMYFSFADGVYVRGAVYWLSQVYPIGILLIDMGIILRYRRALGAADTMSLLSYEVLPALAMLIQIFVYGITLLYIATTLSLLIVYITVYLEQSRRLSRQENELTQAKISIMLSQIQPHFLYNSLTAISQLCDVDPKQAKTATILFSQYLRNNLDSLTQTSPVPFEKELTHINVYLTLEKMRFADDLHVIYDIQVTAFNLPALSVQPLVENAVKYGVGEKNGGGTVTISTGETETAFLVTVSDDGIGFDPEKIQYDGRKHIGIDNVRSRIASQCGGKLTVESRVGEGTKMTVTIPKRTEAT